MLESLTADSIIKEIEPVMQGVIRPEKPVLYFGRAIRGGREELENSRKIAVEGDRRFFIISKHVILDKRYDKDDVSDFERIWKERFTGIINVRQRDMRMLRVSDCFAADLTVESNGVEYEFCFASEERKIPSVLFCNEKEKEKRDVWKYRHGIKSPIFYYNNQNVEDVARTGFEKLSRCFLASYF